jgi:hypothetical protein
MKNDHLRNKNFESRENEKDFFGILWFFVIFFIVFNTVIFLGISFEAATKGWPANSIDGGIRGKEIGSQLGAKFGGLILLGTIFVTALLTSFEKLPGTKIKNKLP